jgi:hypothetical protein
MHTVKCPECNFQSTNIKEGWANLGLQTHMRRMHNAPPKHPRRKSKKQVDFFTTETPGTDVTSLSREELLEKVNRLSRKNKTLRDLLHRILLDDDSI